MDDEDARVRGVILDATTNVNISVKQMYIFAGKCFKEYFNMSTIRNCKLLGD